MACSSIGFWNWQSKAYIGRKNRQNASHKPQERRTERLWEIRQPDTRLAQKRLYGACRGLQLLFLAGNRLRDREIASSHGPTVDSCPQSRPK